MKEIDIDNKKYPFLKLIDFGLVEDSEKMKLNTSTKSGTQTYFVCN
jgi:hypothetical protein